MPQILCTRTREGGDKKGRQKDQYEELQLWYVLGQWMSPRTPSFGATLRSLPSPHPRRPETRSTPMNQAAAVTYPKLLSFDVQLFLDYQVF